MESEIIAVISGNGKRFKYINLYIWSVGLFQYWQIQLHSYLWSHQIVSFNSRLVEKYLVFKCLSIIYSLVYDLIKKKEKKINTQVTSSVGKERKRYSHFFMPTIHKTHLENWLELLIIMLTYWWLGSRIQMGYTRQQLWSTLLVVA